MIILDLFAGAGGAAAGYATAGFGVVGVDVNSQPNYPFDIITDDALAVLREWPGPYGYVDAIHASPPCQGYSTQTAKPARHPQLIEEVRDLLRQTGLPYVIENVEGAARRLIKPIRLCGSTFGLDLRRHRYFETDWPCVGAPCNHAWQIPRFRSLDMSMVRANRLASVVGVHGHINYPGEAALRRRAMGIDWMTNAELAEAIPPAYTEFIGAQLIAYLKAKRGLQV